MKNAKQNQKLLMLMGMILYFFLIALKQVNALAVATISRIHLQSYVSGINQARHIEWHETCKCKCRFEHSVRNNKQRWNDDKCRYECKELIDKGVCNKGFICNPNNCECECYKSCNFSEYLHYKRLAEKLVEECTKNIEETRLVEITSAKNESKHKCSSYTLYIALFSIIFTGHVGIGSYFLYFHWYFNKDVICVKFGTRTQTAI